MTDTFSKVKAIIVDLLGVDESKVTPQSRFREDLEADSLDLVELAMALEDKFGAEIHDEDAQKIKTVGDAVKFVEGQKAKLHKDEVEKEYQKALENIKRTQKYWEERRPN